MLLQPLDLLAQLVQLALIRPCVFFGIADDRLFLRFGLFQQRGQHLALLLHRLKGIGIRKLRQPLALLADNRFQLTDAALQDLLRHRVARPLFAGRRRGCRFRLHVIRRDHLRALGHLAALDQRVGRHAVERAAQFAIAVIHEPAHVEQLDRDGLHPFFPVLRNLVPRQDTALLGPDDQPLRRDRTKDRFAVNP